MLWEIDLGLKLEWQSMLRVIDWWLPKLWNYHYDLMLLEIYSNQ